MTKIESQLEDVKFQLDQSEAAVDMNEATDMIALDSDEDITCVDGEKSPVIQRLSGSRGGSAVPICSESENSNDCLFGGLVSDEESTNEKPASKQETSTNEKSKISKESTNERPKRRYDPSNPPLHSKSEVFLRKLHQAQVSFQIQLAL